MQVLTSTWAQKVFDYTFSWAFQNIFHLLGVIVLFEQLSPHSLETHFF